jgi:hypothetical protein
VAAPHEAWIGADPLRGGFKVLMTGPHGLERSVSFALDEVPAFITAQCGRPWKTQRRTGGTLTQTGSRRNFAAQACGLSHVVEHREEFAAVAHFTNR